MELKDLKLKIQNKDLNNSIIIFIDDIGFISKQYVQAISKIRNIPIVSIDNLSDAVTDNSLFDTTSDLFLYKCDILKDTLPKTSDIIVICKKVDKNISEMYADVIVQIPKVLDWQIEDYCTTKAKGVESKDLAWLIDSCKRDIFKIDNELNKIAIFDEKIRKIEFKNFIKDNIFSDLSPYTIFSLTNAIITKNLNELKDIYLDLDKIDVNAMGLLTILYNNFKNIINIQLGVNPTAESLNMNPKQFAAIKYRIGRYSKNDLVSIFNLLTSIDQRLKLGELPADVILDYVVMKILISDNTVKIYERKY